MAFKSSQDRDWYYRRGDLVHQSTVWIDQGTLEMAKVRDWSVGILGDTGDITPYCEAYLKFKQQVRPEVILCEHEVTPCLGVVGHLDRVFKYPCIRQRVVCDIKTNQCDDATALQTMAYSLGLSWVTRRMGLALKDNGQFKVTWYTDNLRDLATWNEAVATAFRLKGIQHDN